MLWLLALELGVWRPLRRKEGLALWCVVAAGATPEHHAHFTFPTFHTCWVNVSQSKACPWTGDGLHTSGKAQLT